MRTITDYITADTAMPQFFPYPCFLLKMDLSYTARLLYALLLDRSTLSQKNGWQDSEGRTYIVYPVSEITEMLDKGSTAIKSALNELDAAGLLVRERRGFSAPNRLYVKIPQVPVVQFSDHMTAIEPENRPSDSRKTDPHKGGKPTLAIAGKPTPNQFTINQLKENQLKGASGELPATFGRYENVFLSEKELAELQEELPGKWEYYIDRLSGYIASSGKKYKNHAATIRRWAADDRAKEKPKKRNPRLFLQRGREPLTA